VDLGPGGLEDLKVLTIMAVKPLLGLGRVGEVELSLTLGTYAGWH
jgi:hypothetical protein